MLVPKKASGFTILEMLVVLSLSSLLILLPVLQVKSWQERLHVTYFFKEFECQIIALQQTAIITGDSVEITVIEGEQEMVYHYHTPQGEQMKDHLLLPEQISVAKDTRIKFIGETGNISKLDRFVFTDHLSGSQLTYQYQIGSGRFVKKENR